MRGQTSACFEWKELASGLLVEQVCVRKHMSFLKLGEVLANLAGSRQYGREIMMCVVCSGSGKIMSLLNDR